MGIPIRLHWTFLFIILVVAWSFGSSSQPWFGNTYGFGNVEPLSVRWIFSIAFAILLFICVGLEYPQDNASVSILVPSMMYKAGYTYKDLVDAVGYAGPGGSQIDYVRKLAPRADIEGANMIIYVPEGTTTSPSVPISETNYLELYLAEFITIGLEHPSMVLNYGPSLELVSDPDTWEYHRFYDLDEERVCNLAAMLPDGSYWPLRVNTPENMYEDDADGFRAAIKEYVDAIHCGNPTIRILMHLSLQPRSSKPDSVEQYMFYANAAEGLYDQLYAGIDYPFPYDPYYDEEGSKAALIEC